MGKLIRSCYLLLLALFLVACGGDGGEEQSSSAPPAEEPREQEVAASPPALLSLPLTDARNGASFRLSDYAGQTVFIEPMATW